MQRDPDNIHFSMQVLAKNPEEWLFVLLYLLYLIDEDQINQILIIFLLRKPILNNNRNLIKELGKIIWVPNLIMGNRQRMISKNFYVPNTALDQNAT